MALVALVIGVATVPAGAHHDLSCPYHNETEFKNLPVGCRNFLNDPGVGKSLTRSDIMAHPELYGRLGITEQFVWYAQETVRQVAADDVVRWNSCAYEPGPGNACAPERVISNVRDDLPPSAFDDPIPTIAGSKFLDRDRDGERGPGEPGLEGWRIHLQLVESFVAGRSPGAVAETVTGADGGYRFRLRELPPGRYRVTEESRPGWAQTRQPAEVVVPFGLGDGLIGGNDFGNVEIRADVVKASFALVDPPAELSADEPAELTVRATLRNDGPADIVDVTDTLTVTGPDDCAIVPRRQTITRRLVEGEVQVVHLPVSVTCADPSFHPFDFLNELEVTTSGVSDPDTSDNRAQFSHTFDLAVGDVVLACDGRSDVDQPFACSVTATVSNAGPHPDALADLTTSLELPADCAATSDTAFQPQAAVVVGAPVTVTGDWVVTCANRSHHRITAQVTAESNQLHVVDPDPADNHAGTAVPYVVEIFEAADLAVVDLAIACDEFADSKAFRCMVTTHVVNHGVAEGVDTMTDLVLTAPEACIVDRPAVTHGDDLDAGEAVFYTDAFEIVCSDGSRQVLRAAATIRADEPHAEDRNGSNDGGEVLWLPTDVKPRSFPNAVNPRQRGLIPVAVLSTATFDAPASVVPESLRFGATGEEASWVRCGAPEDVDSDGLADLVCHFDATLTGLTCASEVAVLTGRLREGTDFASHDSVKVAGCR